MTTTVKVIAAQWPVSVILKDEVAGSAPIFTPQRVEPNSASFI